MQLNWKHFNVAIWIFILIANLSFNIWFYLQADASNDAWGTGMAMIVFVYYFAPIAIIVSLILLLLLKSKYVKGNHKNLSMLFIILMYVINFFSVIYLS